MLGLGAAPFIVPQEIRRACASLSLVLKRFAGGFVTDGFLSFTGYLCSDSFFKVFLASASHYVGKEPYQPRR